MAEALGPERSLPDRAYPFRSLLEVHLPMTNRLPLPEL